ncbi:cyclase family protein [Okibacterium endophyticum]
MERRNTVSKARFDEIVEAVRVWGRPGVADEPALFTRITPERTVAALAGVTSGRVISLGRPWPVQPAVDNHRPALHYMSDIGSILADGDTEPTCYKDFIGVDYHGKTMSHIDAFSHIAYDDQIFGGVSATGSLTAEGMASGDVTDFGALVTRGVLVDMAAAGGASWTEPGTAWSLSDIRRVLDAQGVELQNGDAVLFRSGHDRRRRELGPWDPDAAGAGVHVEAVPWLFASGVAMLGADGETDVRPSPVELVTLPIHVLALTMAGVPLLDNLDLDELGRVCRETGRYTFALAVTPLNIPGGTGSPVNPVAIF